MAERVDEATRVADGLPWIVHGLRATGYADRADLGVSGAQLFVLRELAAEPGAPRYGRLSAAHFDRSELSVSARRGAARRARARGPEARPERRSAERARALSARKALLKKAPEPYQARLIAALRTLSRAACSNSGRRSVRCSPRSASGPARRPCFSTTPPPPRGNLAVSRRPRS